MAKNHPAMWETWVQSLGWEDPLENGTATNSSILAWRIPWIEEPGGLQSMGVTESDTTEWLALHFTISEGFKESQKQKDCSKVIWLNSPPHVPWCDCQKWSYSYQLQSFLFLSLIIKAFLNEQCKETEENNRMRSNSFKKIGDTKVTFLARMGSIRGKNDLTEEEIKKRWHKYTKELY